MATTRLYLDLRGKAKDGKGNVIITIAHNRTTTSISTGVRLSKEEWRGQKVINREDKDILNAVLADRKNQVDKRIAILALESRFETMTASAIKEAVDITKKPVTDKTSVVRVFNDYLKQPLAENTKSLYHVTLSKVLSFGKSGLKIQDIDYKWILGFESYLAKAQSVNGRAIYLRCLRAVCKYAYRTKLISDYPFDDFKVKQVPTEHRTITIEKLRELYHFKCKPFQQVYKDYFFLMFFLIGINAKDLFLAKRSAVHGSRLEYIRAKTKRQYSIKIEPEALELLNKYSGRNYLVEVMDRCKNYSNYVHEMNDALGQIGTIVDKVIPADDLFSEPKVIKAVEPIIPDLTTYFARHTWATIAHELGISVDVISQALGHSIGNRTTLIYVKPDQNKVDEANRRIIDYLLYE